MNAARILDLRSRIFESEFEKQKLETFQCFKLRSSSISPDQADFNLFELPKL